MMTRLSDGTTKGQLFDSLWTLTGKREKDQRLDMPLAGATGISGGAATAIIPMLHVAKDGSRWGTTTTDLLNPVDKGQEETDEINCWKIEGKAKFGDTKVTLWIDDDGLIRKIYNETVVDPAILPAEAKARLPATHAMPAFTTFSTITIKPFINELKIDDSMFTTELNNPN